MRVALITELDSDGYQLKEEYERKYDFALDLYNEYEDYLSLSDDCRKVIVKDKESGEDIFRLFVNPRTGEIEEEEPQKPKKPWKPRAGFGGKQKGAGRPKGSKNWNRKGLDKTLTICISVPMWRYLKRMKNTGEFVRSAIKEKHDRIAEERKKYVGRYDYAEYRKNLKEKNNLQKNS